MVLLTRARAQIVFDRFKTLFHYYNTALCLSNIGYFISKKLGTPNKT